MAIRSNVGNIITNGMQILSVGATTASRVLGDYSKTLNNSSLSQEDKDTILKAKEQKQLRNAQRELAGGTDIYQHMTNEQASSLQKARAEKALSITNEEEEESIDKLGITEVSNDNQIEEKVNDLETEQMKQANPYIFNNIKWAEEVERLRATEGME